MNKKFLSAVLFGALMVSSTGTFVSCKDYDDDIDQINQELTEVKSAIAALQAKVDGGKYVTNVVKNGEGITVTWNDNSTSTIETIKGDKGEDGKNGTVVTIVDGYWAFDGVKSEYPAKGDKGDKGDKGENGENGVAAAAGHDATISEDGYWMVWDADKSEYVKTEYIAGGATAAQVKGGWNISVKDANGDVQTIFIPGSATMGYMDVLNGANPMRALYGINAKDVAYGPAKAKKTLKKGLYTTLDRDLQVVVNPQGTDASAYSYSLMNSANVNTGLLFKEAVPFKGVLTRASSENAVWVLPHDFVRYENIDDARTKNYLLFKANDGRKHALSLTAMLNETTIKTPYDLSAQLKKIGDVTVHVYSLENCAVNVAYTPVVSYVSPSVDAAAVYDYWITLEQSAKNLKNAQLYGVEIDSEGHSFKFTRETGVNNYVEFVYNYILMDGTVVEGDADASHFFAYQREEQAVAKSIALERLYTPMDAKLIIENDRDPNYNPTLKGYGYSYANKAFALNTKEYDLSTLISQMSDVEKVVWKSAIAAGRVDISMIGGEGDNNQQTFNSRLAQNIRYAFNKDNDKITFQFLVSDSWNDFWSVEDGNFWLDNAYELTLTVIDEDTQTPVGSIVLPFEFTQPTLDITRVDGKFTEWNKDQTALYVYGHLCNSNDDEMRLPLYDSFAAWKAKNGSTVTGEYQKYKDNAEFYNVSFNVPVNTEIMGQSGVRTAVVSLDNALNYAGVDHNLNTMAKWAVLNWEAGNNPQTELEIPMSVDYNYYGVYPSKEKNFDLYFASWLKHSTLATKEAVYTTDRGTHQVLLTNDDIDFKTPKGGAFYLFDDLKGTKAAERAIINGETFNEVNHYPFTGFSNTTKTYGSKGITGLFQGTGNHFKAVEAGNMSTPVNVVPSVLNARNILVDPTTGVRYIDPTAVTPHATDIKVYLVPSVSQNVDSSVVTDQIADAFRGGMLVVLPQNYNEQDGAVITVTLKDIWGYEKSFKFTVTKL